MRILKVVQAYYPFQEKGGPVVKVRSLARGLAQRGHSITVLTADLGLAKLDTSNMKAERFHGGWRWKHEGIETIYLDTVGSYRALTFNPSVFAFCRSRLSDFDFVHFYGIYDLLGPSVGSFCRERQVPYAIEPMGMYRPIDRSFRLKRLWHRLLGKPFFSNAAEVVVTSELEQSELVEDGMPAEKVVLRYNGIDTDLFSAVPPRGIFRGQYAIPADAAVILFLSRLIPRKGADRLIEAFAKACPDSAWLVIAGPEGEPGYRKYLESCAEKSGAKGRILFTGAIYDDQKKALLVDSNIFALPSRYENFANVAAEAIACDVPVVVTDSCGIASLVHHRAGLVISTNQTELADALQSLIYDKVLYSSLKAGCRSVALQLDWNHLAEQMESYYFSAMGNGAEKQVELSLRS
jgi:glycosyltransferase involved in cell wall biosynthesis